MATGIVHLPPHGELLLQEVLCAFDVAGIGQHGREGAEGAEGAGDSRSVAQLPVKCQALFRKRERPLIALAGQSRLRFRLL